MIEIDNIVAGYQDQEVLKGISLKIIHNEMIGILGPNGSGKTTLIMALTGVVPIRSGEILLDGKPVRTYPTKQMAKKVACVPQKSEISFDFTNLSIVLMGRYPYLDSWAGYSKEDREVAKDAMRQTGILKLAHKSIKRVSGGEAQLVTVARAIAQTTEILILDEATSNLDAAKKIQVFDLLTKKNHEGATVICVLHDLNLAALYCKRLVFLKNGKVVIDGQTQDVFKDSILSEIYETDIRVSKHPVTGTPQAHFVPFCNVLDSGDSFCRNRFGGVN